jgi:hypothetical protein
MNMDNTINKILSDLDIDELLQQQYIGRLACQQDGHLYVLPISYAYKNNCLYMHSFEGKKISMMRNNPNVCFEVDDIQDIANWKSAIVWGIFEELTDTKLRLEGLTILISRSLPIINTSVTSHLEDNWPFPLDENLDDIEGCVFRIQIHQKTGRYRTLKYFKRK